MARGIPSYDGCGGSCDGAGGGSGREYQYTTQCSSSTPSSLPRFDSSYYSSLNGGSIGDVFFGSDDIKDARDLTYKEDVLESFRRERAMKSLRRRSKKESISNFGCVAFLKLLFCCCSCLK